MTIKQVFFGVVLVSSTVGLMVHRLHKAQAVDALMKLASAKATVHKEHPHKAVSLSKNRHLRKRTRGSESELSSQKLYAANRS